jgi:hypothetical protein
MGGTKVASDRAARNGGKRPVRSAALPRWVTIPFVLIIGSILWIGVLSDSSGHLIIPGVDSILYIAAVIGVAVLLAYADRKGR